MRFGILDTLILSLRAILMLIEQVMQMIEKVLLVGAFM